MGKCLGIDFGLKRTGMSISDEFNKIAFPLKTVKSDSLINEIQDINKTDTIEKIIIGKPYDLKGNLSTIETNILSLIKLLNTKFPDILVDRIDERFTSKIAKQVILESGLGKTKRRDKKYIDKISATLILQSYLKK
ncbi:MAG: Holliday junction resolvase RuvX [Pelagibacterales bacterium]|jgi:putative Holliday junction resolvase|nr:Holliday junction resolvase RuvX [Pelagibacterales bacterium]